MTKKAQEDKPPEMTNEKKRKLVMEALTAVGVNPTVQASILFSLQL